MVSRGSGRPEPRAGALRAELNLAKRLHGQSSHGKTGHKEEGKGRQHIKSLKL